MAAQRKGPEKAKSAANAIVTTTAVVAALVLVNLIATRFPRRLDLTEDGIYKLSQTSIDLVKGLPDRVNVKLFVSEDLPPPLNQYSRYVGDLLDEYKLASGGKFDWERIDPLAGKDEEEKKKKQEDLGKYKIQKITLERITENKLELGTDNYLGVAFVYGDQIDSIPQVLGTDGLEYQITGMVKKLSASKKKKIGFTSSEGELSPSQGLQYLTKVIGQDYDTATVALDKPVPDDIDALYVCGPKQPFNDKAKYFLDQYLMKGKPVALFVDGMKLEAPQGLNIPGMEQPKIGQANDVNLQSLLDAWGLKIHDDLVFDERNARGAVPVQGQMFLTNYPTFVAVAREGIAEDHVITKGLGAVVMPFASSIELTGELKEGKGGVKATALATSSQRSWRNTGFFMFNPLQKLKRPESPNDQGPFVMAYALEGKFKSAFPNGMPGADPGTSNAEGGPAIKESPDGARLLLVASSAMINDQDLLVQYEPAYRANLQFAANAADWAIKDNALMSLRAKGMTQRPFVAPLESKATFWKWFIQLGVPALLIACGLVLSWLRSARRRGATLESLGS